MTENNSYLSQPKSTGKKWTGGMKKLKKNCPTTGNSLLKAIVSGHWSGFCRGVWGCDLHFGSKDGGAALSEGVILPGGLCKPKTDNCFP